MGPYPGDVDRNGRLDIYIPDMGYSSMLMNQGDGFEDATTSSGIGLASGQFTGWGGLLLDYDNDGHLDLFVSNGDAHHEYPEEDVLLHNRGNSTFLDVSRDSGAYFHVKKVGRGSTFGDFDNDGDLDILIANINDDAILLRNDGGNANNWLKVVPRLGNPERDAIGARVTVTVGTLKSIEDLIPVRGYLAQVDSRLHFGLGKASRADRVEIRWPDGILQTIENVPANQILRVVKPQK